MKNTEYVQNVLGLFSVGKVLIKEHEHKKGQCYTTVGQMSNKKSEQKNCLGAGSSGTAD